MKKSLIIILSIIFFIFISVFSTFLIFYTGTKPVNKTENANIVRIEIPSGMSVSAVAEELANENLIKNPKVFYLTIRFPVLMKLFFPKEDFRFVLKSGIYYVKDTMNIAEIQKLLSSGQIEYVKVSIPEGLTISKIGVILEKNRICSKDDFYNAAHNIDIVNSYNIPSESLEGYLFPDTYFLNLGMSGESIVRLMVNNFFDKIKTVPNLAEKNPEDLFYTVKLASIVEREYGLAEEAPLIASVFKNRLRLGMGLYSCATLEYIITEIEGRPHPERILIEDTKIDSPYNTYMWAGLPPGPISNPGLVALNASTNTPKTKYYFFQVVDPVTRRQEFTETFDEHKVNHNLYTKKSSGN